MRIYILDLDELETNFEPLDTLKGNIEKIELNIQ